MILDASYPVKNFIEFINQNYPVKEPCYIVYLSDYDTVEADDENIGFACYHPNSRTMYIAGNLRELQKEENLSDDDIQRIIYESIAHEYTHHIQCIENKYSKESNEEMEEEAHKLAEEIVNKFYNKEKQNATRKIKTNFR